MAEHVFYITIASPTETLYQGEAYKITVPTSTGIVTILPHHEPLITTLKQGKIHLTPVGQDAREYVVEGGVIEIAHNRVSVLL